MSRKVRLYGAVAGVICLGALTVTAVTLAPSGSAKSTVPKSTSGVTNSVAANTAQQSASLNYWTPARMGAAKPYPIPVAHIQKNVPSKQSIPGKAGSAGGTAPSGVKAATQIQSAPAAASAVQPALNGGLDYPFPYTRYPVYPAANRNTYPWTVNGKLFFTQDGGSFVCSATSVVAPSKTRVWTAGHCVASGEGLHHFDTSAVFVPAYNNGTAPFGTFAATNYTTATAWINNGDLSVDFGAFHTGKNAKGQTLAAAVGTAGFTWNQSDEQEWLDDAWPQAAPFNGKTEQEVNAPTAVRVNIGGIGQDAMGIGSNLTGGSSGGSWRMYAGGQYVGFVGSHNDFKITDPAQPLAMYGPYFTDLANAVRCSTEVTGNGCP